MEKYKVILVDDEIEAIQAMEHKMDCIMIWQHFVTAFRKLKKKR